MKETFKRKDIISGTILVAFLTAFSYHVSYMFQSGFYNYFNLPSFLVEITITNTLVSIFSIFSFLLVLFLVTKGLISLIPSENPYIIKIIRKYIYFLIIFYLFNMFDNKSHILILIPLPLFLIIDFILPLFQQKNVKGYKNKIISNIKGSEKKDNIFGYENFIRSDLFKSFRIIPLLLLIIYLTSLFTYGLGEYSAKNKKTFTFINNDRVILGTYEKKFIVKNLNIKENALESSFYLVSNQEKYKYNKRKIETLKIK